jgi:protein phosphatase-4 regulatory subunit 3
MSRIFRTYATGMISCISVTDFPLIFLAGKLQRLDQALHDKTRSGDTKIGRISTWPCSIHVIHPPLGNEQRTFTTCGRETRKVCQFFIFHYTLSDRFRRPTDTRPRPGRHIEAEEEDYFNADDDEDDIFVPTISSQWTRGQAPGPSMNSLKRKRRSAMGNIMRVFRSPNLASLRTGSLGNLVDYNDDDDPGGLSDEDSLSSLASLPLTSQNKIPPKPSLAPSPSIPTSPKLTHRQILTSTPPPPLRSPSSSDDDEDNLLESLVRSKPPRSLSTGTSSSKLVMGPTRLSEKRRREEDDDGPFSRLSKARKPDLGFEKDGLTTGGGGRTGSSKVGDDPPKKIKLKFGTTSLGLVSASSSAGVPPSTPTPSEAGAKDGDTG